MTGSWLGRTLRRSRRRFAGLELFDKSMTLAAEVFTAVFPILIMTAIWLGSQHSDEIAQSLGMPTETQRVLRDALNGSSATFGLVGVLVVFASATSLSRALTRAFATIWEIARPRTGLRGAWRWVGVVIIIAVVMVLIRWLFRLTDDWQPGGVWGFVTSLVLTTIGGALVPWILLSGRVPARCLAPGAFIFGLVVSTARPVSHDLLGQSLDDSAEQYGTIGVAFTYIAFLYALSLCFLVSAFLGQLIATDEGRLGRWIRGERASETRAADDSVTRSFLGL